MNDDHDERGRESGGAGPLTAAVRAVDEALHALDGWSRDARDSLLRAARLRPEQVTVRRALERSPGWVRSGIESVGAGLERLGRRLGRALYFLPQDPQWRQAATGVALLLLIVTLGGLVAPPEARPFPGVRRPLFVGYFENGWNRVLRDSFPTLQNHADQVDIIMPFWYSVQPDGRVEERAARSEVVEFARARGIQVFPLFSNAKGPGSGAFLLSPAGRSRAVREIVGIVEEWGYDGVHIDFELLPSRYKAGMTTFMGELREALGRATHLSAAVIPILDVHPEIRGLYDYPALAEICDFIVLMAYDRHWRTSVAGPISPRDWVEDNIRHVVEDLDIPGQRLVLGVGGYGLDWPRGGGKANPGAVVPSYIAGDLARRHGATIQWDAESDNPHFTYYEGGTRHDVWYQDERVMAQRIALLRKYGLRGLALWRVGYETPETWRVLRGELGTR